MNNTMGLVLVLFALGLLNASLYGLVMVEAVLAGIPWLAFFGGTGLAAIFIIMVKILPNAIKECHNE